MSLHSQGDDGWTEDSTVLFVTGDKEHGQVEAVILKLLMPFPPPFLLPLFRFSSWRVCVCVGVCVLGRGRDLKQSSLVERKPSIEQWSISQKNFHPGDPF